MYVLKIKDAIKMSMEDLIEFIFENYYKQIGFIQK